MVEARPSSMGIDGPSNSDGDFVEVYILQYNIPCEDAKFFVERTLENGNKIKIGFVPNTIRSKVKGLRFRFYDILRAHRVYNTPLGKIVEPEEVESLKMDLWEWKREYTSIQKLIDHYLAKPWEYDEWPIIRKRLRQFNIKWPPKKLDITRNFYVEVFGPILIPWELYELLIGRSVSNTDTEAYERKP